MIILSGELVVILMFGGLILGITFGVPIGFVLGGIAFAVGYIGWGEVEFTVFVSKIFEIMNNYTFMAIPLFILMANFLMRSNVADDLFDAARYIFGPIRGGIGVAVIVVSTVFAATTGIIGASIVTMGILALPILQKYHYDKKLSVGLICSGGSLGILIPPSIMLIMAGAYAQVSVGRLMMAAIFPGLLLSFFYIIYTIYICWRHPEKGPAMSPNELRQMPVKKRITKSLIALGPPMLLIIGVLGSIFSGVATPTEASGVGAFLTLLLVIAYRRFNWSVIKESVIDTAKTSGLCWLLLFGANAFTSIFMGLNGSAFVVDFLSGIGLTKWTAIVILMFVVFVLGCFIDWMGIVMIVVPVFMPVMTYYGFDPLYIISLICVMMQTCFLTPPFGFALFYMKGIVPPEITMLDIYKGVIPFIVIMCIVVGLCLIFPQILLWLPSISFAT